MLSVNNLGKSFKNKQVLDNISFDVRKGEIMPILGPNGAGKSTTIRNIMGIMYPDEVTVNFEHSNAGEIPHHKIGYWPEDRGLYQYVTVVDILLCLS